MKTRTFLAISIGASLAFLLARQLAAGDWTVVLKAGSVAILAGLGFGIDKRLGAALTLSAVGDLMLGVRSLGGLDEEKLFLLGLGAFLLAHLTYIAMYLRYGMSRTQRPLRILGIGIIVVVLGSMLWSLWPALGPLRIPVLVYALVLSGMGVSAMLADLGNPMAAVGALLFISSDAMLAIGKFRGPFAGRDVLVWVTYYLAQLLIFSGVRAAQSRRAARAVASGQ